MTAVLRNRLLGLAIAGVTYLADQGIKKLVTETLGLNQLGEQIVLLPIFNLTFTPNYGVSFGKLQATSAEAGFLLLGLTGLIALGVLVWLFRERRFGDIAPLGMILGGALGNIHDRRSLGFVIDYADLHFGEFRPFLIFNLADTAITIGVLIILARALFMREKPPAPQGGGEADQPAESSTNA